MCSSHRGAPHDSGWALCRAVSHSPWADVSVSGTRKTQYQMLAGTVALSIQDCQPQAYTVLLGFWTRKSLTRRYIDSLFPTRRNDLYGHCALIVWFSVWLRRNRYPHLCLPCHPTGSVASLLYGSSVDGLLVFGSHSSFLLGLNFGSWNWLGLNLISKLLPGFSPWAWILFLASFKKT